MPKIKKVPVVVMDNRKHKTLHRMVVRAVNEDIILVKNPKSVNAQNEEFQDYVLPAKCRYTITKKLPLLPFIKWEETRWDVIEGTKEAILYDNGKAELVKISDSRLAALLEQTAINELLRSRAFAKLASQIFLILVFSGLAMLFAGFSSVLGYQTYTCLHTQWNFTHGGC